MHQNLLCPQHLLRHATAAVLLAAGALAVHAAPLPPGWTPLPASAAAPGARSVKLDLNGNGRPDHATLVTDARTPRTGIAVTFGGHSAPVLASVWPTRARGRVALSVAPPGTSVNIVARPRAGTSWDRSTINNRRSRACHTSAPGCHDPAPSHQSTK